MIRRHPLVAFFVLAYASSWALWAPLWLPALGVHGLPTLPFHHFAGAFGPAVAAFVVSAVVGGRAACRRLLRAMGAWRGRGGWAALAVAAPLAIAALATVAAPGDAASVDLGGLWESSEFAGLGLGGLLLVNLLTFGFGEEVGWRGFALPRLQNRRSAWRATLLLTAGWAAWHAPLFLYRPGYTAMGLGGAVGWLVSLLTGAVLLTWLYNESRGSLLVVALFHASIDVAFTSQLSPRATTLAGALVTLWGLGVLWVAGPRDLSRRGQVRVESGSAVAP